jgi:hypothetical protein
MSEKNNKKRKSKHNNAGQYNGKDLQINPKETLIIIDWDDTLYPTTWVQENDIDLTNPQSRYKYIDHFERLDNYLCSTLLHMMKLGDVVIITNALPVWIELSVSVLPKTQNCLLHISVISARLRYQNSTIDNKMTNWKKQTFVDEIINRYKTQKRHYTNILSLGDADFEHNALINLYNFELLPHKYLKSIKFIKSSDYTIVLEQIKMINSHIDQICKTPRHIDLTFDTI